VPQKPLDHGQGDTSLDESGREGFPEGMAGELALQPGPFEDPQEKAIHVPRVHGPSVPTRKDRIL